MKIKDVLKSFFIVIIIPIILIITSTTSIVLDKCIFVFLDVSYPFFLAAIYNFFTFVVTLIVTKKFQTNIHFIELPLFFHVKGFTTSVSSILLMYLMYDGVQIETVQVTKTLLPFFASIFPFWILTNFKIPYKNGRWTSIILLTTLISSNIMVTYNIEPKQMLLLFFWILAYSLDFFLDEKLINETKINGITILLYSTMESLILSLVVFFSFDGIQYMKNDFSWMVSPYILLGCCCDTIFSLLIYCGSTVGDYQKVLFSIVLVLSIGIARSMFYSIYSFTITNYVGMGIASIIYFILQHLERKKRVFLNQEEVELNEKLEDKPISVIEQLDIKTEPFGISEFVIEEEEGEEEKSLESSQNIS